MLLRNRKLEQLEQLEPSTKRIKKNPSIVQVKTLSTNEILSKDEILEILSKKMPLEKASIIESFMSKNNITNENVPSIYSSYFFRKDIIREFQNNVIKKFNAEFPGDKFNLFPLSRYNLYNKDDILNNTTYRPDVLGSRNIEKTSSYSVESSENMKKVLTFLTTKICSGIGDIYATSSLEKAIDLTKNEKKFDILIASTSILEKVELPIEERLEGIVAFIIVELGECHKYPAAYSINLICTNTKQAIAQTGSVLMASFLYTILSHPANTSPHDTITFPPGDSFLNVTSKTLEDGSKIENCTFGTNEPLIPVQHIAVLELADSYKNTGGLCMYEKFGFTYDQTMFSDDSKGIDCFKDTDNLPMLIDFNTKPGYDNSMKKEKIINILIGKDRGYEKSKICQIRGDKQRLLGILKSIKLYLENTPANIVRLPSYEENLVHGIKIMHKQGRLPYNEGKIEEVIDYLEKQIDEPGMESKISKLINYIPAKKGGRSSRKVYRKISRGYTKKRN